MFNASAATMTVQNGYRDVEQSYVLHNDMLAKTDFNHLTFLELQAVSNNVQYFASIGFKAHINDLFEILSRSLSLYADMGMEPEELENIIESIKILVTDECHKGFIDIGLISRNLEHLLKLAKPAHKTGLVLQLLCMVAEKNAFRKLSNGEKYKIAPSRINDLLFSIKPAECLDVQKEIIFTCLNTLRELGVSYRINDWLLNRFKPAERAESVQITNTEVTSLVAEMPTITPEPISSSSNVASMSLLIRHRPSNIQTQDLEPPVTPAITAQQPLTPFERRQAQIREISTLLRNNDINGLKAFYERCGLRLPLETTPSPDNAKSKKRKHDEFCNASTPSAARNQQGLFPVITDAQRLQTLVIAYFQEMNKRSEKSAFIEYIQSSDASSISALLLPFRCKKPETLKKFLILMKSGHFDVVLQHLPLNQLNDCVDRLIKPGRIYIAYDSLFHTIENLNTRMKRNRHEKEIITPLIQRLYEIGIEHHGAERQNSRDGMVSVLRRELAAFQEDFTNSYILSHHF